MTTLRFRAPVACVLLLWTCGGSKVLTDTAMTAPAGGRDGGEESTPSSAVCGDIGTDSHNCGACGHDCAGGACSAGICQPVVLAAGLTRPGSMAIDDANVYWTEHSVGRVLSVAKNYTGKITSFRGGRRSPVASGQEYPEAIATDATSVYWLNFGPTDLSEGRRERSGE